MVFDKKEISGYISTMKNVKGIIVLPVILTVSFTAVNAFAKDVSFTQDDRVRLIRVETRLDEGLKAVN